MRRRVFLRDAALGLGAFAGTGLGARGVEPSPANVHNRNKAQEVGRPVRIVSIGFTDSEPLTEIAERVDEEGSLSPDIIVLPELCRGQDKESEEPLHGPTVTAMASLAKKHKTYIVVPIDRRDGNRRFNSTVLLNRSGQVVCVYNKLFPYWSGLDAHPPVDPGSTTQVYHADFGSVGFATCFDVNFPEVWRRLSEQGAELVIWPSAYSAGISLQAHAINHHYYIVSCTQGIDCFVYDITGKELLYDRGKNFNITRVTLDLDRCIFHENFNMQKRDKLLSEHARDVVQDTWLEREQWFVLRAIRPGISARQLASQYGLEELRHYIERSRVVIDKRRGWEFAEKVIFPDKSIARLKVLASETGVGTTSKTHV